MIRALRRGTKRLATAVAAALLGGPGPRDLPAPIQRILVIRIDERVGNVLLTTPLLSALKTAYPEAELDVLVAASKVRILEGLAHPIPFEKRAFFVRPWRLLAQIRRLRARRYDVVIDASHWHHFSASSAVLTALIGGRARIAHDRGAARHFAAHLAAAPERPEPETTTKLRLLGPLGLTPTPAPMATGLGTTAQAQAGVAQWRNEQGLPGVLVGLAPGARKPDHRVDPAVFAAIGRAARAQGATPVVLWGPGEEALAAQVAQDGQARLLPPTDLEALAAWMRACAVVITNDTGPMHLSVAVGAPTVALFRGGEPWRWGHAYDPHVVIATDGRPKEDVESEAIAAVRARLDALVRSPG